MSGQIRQYSPGSQTWVPRGQDGKFAPKVFSQQPAQQPALRVYPERSAEPPRVLSASPSTLGGGTK